MKLKARKFNWIAGRPVVVLNEFTAKKLNVHVGERVSVLVKERKIYAVVDIFPKIVSDGEIGISNEISSIMNIRDKQVVEVGASQLSKSNLILKKKLKGARLSAKELNLIISEIVQNNLSEAELAYFVAAEKAQGMTMKETIALTNAMVKNGNKLNFKNKIVADKHCIGGIAGNRTTPIIVSICASAGLTLPKTSSRAITSAAGTADVIETISNIEFSIKKLKKVVEKTNACLAWGGSLNLAPSDDKIIHVERILGLDIEPQLLSSIISKKVSAGSSHVLIDIPYGKGAKIATRKKAKKLAKKFKQVGKEFSLKIKCVFTRGNKPVGNGIGPVLEMKDILDVLKNRNCPEDLKEKSLYLSSQLMSLCGIKNSKKKAREILSSGRAYEKFKEIINTQNSKPLQSKDFDKQIKKLKTAKHKKIIKANKTGNIKFIDNKKINSLCRVLGTPETASAGCYIHKKSGKVEKGQEILTIYSESKTKLNDAIKYIRVFKPVLIK